MSLLLDPGETNVHPGVDMASENWVKLGGPNASEQSSTCQVMKPVYLLISLNALLNNHSLNLLSTCLNIF